MYISNIKSVYPPLDEISLKGIEKGIITVLDGSGDKYLTLAPGADLVSFRIGGSLGTHTVLHCIDDKLISTLSFCVSTETSLKDSKNIFAPLLKNLYLTMVNSCGGDGAQLIEVENKFYHHFICWLRDHTHTMKGMKYFYNDVKTGLELYADTQREDGMIYDRIKQRKSDAQGWRDYTFKNGNFIKCVYANRGKTGTPYTLQRIPVENDVEFLFLECLYYTWKACGDTEWMKHYLDNAIRAVKYATSDQYRWSEKFHLLKRGYTIDTWDFLHNDDGELTLGDNICDIDKTTFGVMFGDNTGMAAGCRYLAEMLFAAEREDEASKYDQIAKKLYESLEKIAWNGKFYTHHITEDSSFKRDVGNTDEKSQVTLSNAYSINRQIGDEKSKAIIKTYQRIKNEMPANSPGEFYNCYPPFEKGFGKQNQIWQYMNGGVSSITAGELARGAFCFGEEHYGADILLRIKELADRHEGHLHVCFNGNPQTDPPVRSFSTINIANCANINHCYGKHRGWGDSGNDLKNIPKGKQDFAGIPFQIEDQGIGISLNKTEFSREIRIPIVEKYASLYLLHTMNGNSQATEMRVCYADGTSTEISLENGKQLDAWFMPDSTETGSSCHAAKLPKGWPEYQLAWRGGNNTFDNVGIFLWGWDNPRPDIEITEIIFTALKGNGEYLLSAISGSDHPVWFPQSDLSYGIPDGWGAAAVVYAIMEGLVGIIDKGIAFDKVEISPRWQFVEETSADVVVKYEASGGYAAYSWHQTDHGQSLLLTSSAKETVVRLPLLRDKVASITVNGESANFAIEEIGTTKYAKIAISGKGVYQIVFDS